MVSKNKFEIGLLAHCLWVGDLDGPVNREKDAAGSEGGVLDSVFLKMADTQNARGQDGP